MYSRLTGRAALAAVAAGLLALLPGTVAIATPAPPNLPVGTLYTAAKGIPASVKRGQTINLVIWYMQRSKDVLVPVQDQVTLWNPNGVNARGSSAPGVTVSWLNPVTGRWQPSNWITDHNTEQYLVLPATPEIKVTSGYWAHVDARITFSSSAALGTWHVMPEGANGYMLQTAKGAWASGFLNSHPALFSVTVHR